MRSDITSAACQRGPARALEIGIAARNVNREQTWRETEMLPIAVPEPFIADVRYSVAGGQATEQSHVVVCHAQQPTASIGSSASAHG
jgi:hypothetical protein